jgi:hypothetical protein
MVKRSLYKRWTHPFIRKNTLRMKTSENLAINIPGDMRSAKKISINAGGGCINKSLHCLRLSFTIRASGRGQEGVAEVRGRFAAVA